METIEIKEELIKLCLEENAFMKIVSYLVRFTIVRDSGKRAISRALLKMLSLKFHLNGHYYNESGYGSFFNYLKDFNWVVFIADYVYSLELAQGRNSLIASKKFLPSGVVIW